MESKIVYFERPGNSNTEEALKLAAERAAVGDLSKALVASTGGDTGLAALNFIDNMEVIVVTHSYGFKAPNVMELTPENREAIEGRGGKILTCQHALGGIGRAVRKKWGTYELEEIIAHSLRLFGEGTKVCVEMAMMAADAGLVDYAENVLAIAGTGRGADTVLVLKAANAQYFFDLRIQEIICKPRFP